VAVITDGVRWPIRIRHKQQLSPIISDTIYSVSFWLFLHSHSERELSFFPFFLLQTIFFSSHLKFKSMELVGRLTANAVVSTTKSDRKVVNFSVAINDRYKPKDGEAKEVTTFVNCSYWISSAIAEHLTKGTLVELNGRISVNAWKNMEGEPKASLNFHVNAIKLHGKAGSAAKEPVPAPAEITEPLEDLPF
jgi:single-strand DNA-binding protein